MLHYCTSVMHHCFEPLVRPTLDSIGSGRRPHDEAFVAALGLNQMHLDSMPADFDTELADGWQTMRSNC